MAGEEGALSLNKHARDSAFLKLKRFLDPIRRRRRCSSRSWTSSSRTSATVRSAPRWRERERPSGARQGGESERDCQERAKVERARETVRSAPGWRDRQERAKVERARETVMSAPGWRERETELREHGCGSRPVGGQSESASFEMKGAFAKSRPVRGRAMRRIQQDRRVGAGAA